MSDRQGTTISAGASPAGHQLHWGAAALAAYAVAVPLGLAILLGASGAPVISSPFSAVWLAMAIVGPAGLVIAALVRGPARVSRDLAEFPDQEPQQAFIRLFFPGLMLAYLIALAAFGIESGRLMPLLAIGVSAVLCEWLLLVDLITRPWPSPLRRAVAMLTDVSFVSIFLHVGGPLGAPWFSVYLWIVLGFGLRFGRRALVPAAILSFVGFAAVCATTPYWQERTALAAGILLALALLPAYAAILMRSLTLANAQAEEANAAKSRFLALMSHELRTPLNSMIGIGTLFSRTELDAEQRDMLASMQLSARTLLGLINDILDFSKIEAGRLQPEVEGFVLHEVLGSAVAMLRPQAEAKGLLLSLRIDPRLPYAYRGLPQQLRQILVNLIANAIKFTSEGRIELSARLVERGEGKVHLRLAVADDGIGIAPEARDRVFDVYGQTDGAAARRPGGSGLGLAIAKQLTQLLGGTISVDSVLGKGSTFSVELVLPEDPDGTVRPPDLAGREIVLVTGDGELAQLLQTWLQGWQGETRWVSDSDAALQELAASAPSVSRLLLVLDGRTDTLAGLSLAHRLIESVPRPPLTLFLAPVNAGSSIDGVAGGHFAAIIEPPITQNVVAAALLAAVAGDARTGAAPAILASPATAPASSMPALPAPARKLKILLAEDNGANRKILRRILEVAGHQVTVTNDGEAALAMLDRERFDLALLDINMPEMSGYELTKLYRMEHLGEGRLPIIALTADPTPETERQCRDAGMDAVLTKPVEAAQLLAAIDDTYARVAESAPSTPISPVVTPISAHPRYFADTGAVVDEATIHSLRTLGGASDFFHDIIDTFCSDGARLLELLRSAIAAGDLRSFKELTHSLRSGAANVGAARLCQTLTTLRDVTVQDLRQHGDIYVEKLQGEFAKLEATLSRIAKESRLG